MRDTGAVASAETRSLIPLIVYLVLFYLVWTFVWVYGVYPWANRTLGNATLTYALVNILFRLLVWVLPVFAYLRYIDRVSVWDYLDRVNVWDYLQLRQHWRRGVSVGVTLSVLNFLGTMARIGPPDWSRATITWNSVLGTSILVGVFEEVPFRGFVLRKLQDRFDVVTSVVISSLLFVGAHVPGWIMLSSLTAFNIVYIFVFGVIMAIVLRYSRSLWAPIIAHSLNDALSNVIFHI